MIYPRTGGLLVVLLLLASSCATTKVKVRTTLGNGVPLDTVALVSTVIGPMFQPTFPLVDAAAFNKKTNDVADVILAEEEGLVREFRATLLEDLRRHVPAAVVTTEAFEREPAVERFLAGGSVQTDNKNFPVAFFAPGDLNVVAFDNAKSVDRLFAATPAFTEYVKAVGKATGAESIVMSYNRLAIVNVGILGTSGSLRLETHLFLFARDGRQLIEVYGVTKPTVIGGKLPAEYSFQLSQFEILSEMMAKELAKHVR